MVSLHHPPIGLRLTRLDHLPFMVGIVQLKAVLHEETQHTIRHEVFTIPYGSNVHVCSGTHRFPGFLHFSDAEVLQRDNSTWFLVLKSGETHQNASGTRIIPHAEAQVLKLC